MPRRRGPEAGGIGGERFVDPDDGAVAVEAELELRVGDDHAPRGGVRGRLGVDREREVAQARREVVPDRAGHRLERDVLVVPRLRLRGGREDRLGKTSTLPGGRREAERRRRRRSSGSPSSRSPRGSRGRRTRTGRPGTSSPGRSVLRGLPRATRARRGRRPRRSRRGGSARACRTSGTRRSRAGSGPRPCRGCPETGRRRRRRSGRWRRRGAGRRGRRRRGPSPGGEAEGQAGRWLRGRQAAWPDSIRARLDSPDRTLPRSHA